MQTMFRRFTRQRHRGVIDPLTALAVASMVLTAAGTARQIHRGAESALTADELRYNSNQVADGLRQILAVKYQRMHQNGQLNRAEYETLQDRLQSDSTRRALQAAANELANRQTQLSEDAFWDLQRDSAISVALSGVGEAAGAIARRGGDAAQIARNVKRADRVAAGADTLSTLLTVDGLVKNVSRNPYIVNDNDFRNALSQVQQHVRGAASPASNPAAMRRGSYASGSGRSSTSGASRSKWTATATIPTMRTGSTTIAVASSNSVAPTSRSTSASFSRKGGACPARRSTISRGRL